MDPNFRPEGQGQPPPFATVVYQPQGPPRPKPRFARTLLVFLAIGLAGSLLLNLLLFGALGISSLGLLDTDHRVQEKFHSHQRTGADKVAILSLEGTIISGEGFIKRQIDRAADDDGVKAVVFRVDSPGGTITGSDFIYYYLKKKLREEKRIPVVVSMGGLAASGGYYVSMACGDTPNVIFAEPTTWTGSIGVVIPHYDLSPLLEKWGVKNDSIASHPLKQIGSYTKPMTEKERQILQELVDDGFTRFKDVIKQGRPKFRNDPQALDALATGQIYTAEQALKGGLVDRIGFIEDAVDRAIELAQLDPDNVKVVEYKRELGLAEVLLDGQSQTRQSDLAAVLELTAPRAYYLCTWLPPLAHSAKP